jgi:hypothetical protein
VRLSLWNSTANGPTIHPPDDTWVNMESQRNDVERGKPVPVPLCPPQIRYGLPWERTRASAVRSRRITAWAVQSALRQHNFLLNYHREELKMESVCSSERPPWTSSATWEPQIPHPASSSVHHFFPELATISQKLSSSTDAPALCSGRADSNLLLSWLTFPTKIG